MSAFILELDRVTKRFGLAVTADRLSLRVARGEFFTFLGPSGSGKSTVLRMIAGLEKPDAGRILIGGREVTQVEPWHRNLGMVFQQYALFPHMSVADNIAYGLKVKRLAQAELRARVSEMLRMVGLGGLEDKSPSLLSGGEQQRVALARALAPQPALLLLDEPLSALDEKIRREMQGELKRIHRETGTTFLYVTHDQEEALTMSDRIALLQSGACVQCDAPERIYRRPRTRFVAQFFRGCNVIEAELAGADGRAEVRFAGVSIPLETDGCAGRHPGRVALAVRAEDLHLGEAAARHRVQIGATLQEVVYRGTNLDFRLLLEDGQALTATSTRRDLEAGAGRITVGLRPADLVLLED